jgi:dTDP-4-dehydrorhamnose reductase
VSNEQDIRSDVFAVILGGTGLAGLALVKEAKKRGLTVVTVARRNADCNLDVSNTKELLSYLRKVRPRCVINTVAMINLDHCEKNPGEAYIVNAALVGHLSSFCQTEDVKLCQISTDHYYSGDAKFLHNEKSSIALLNEYARTKYAGECFALTNPSSLVLRTNIVGFRNWNEQPTFAEWVIRELTANNRITMFNDFFTSSIDVKTFSKAVFDLINADSTGVLNVASSECFSKMEFIQLLSSRLRLDISNCISGTVKTNSGITRAESLGLDVSCCESILGYKLPTLDAVVQSIAHGYEEFK